MLHIGDPIQNAILTLILSSGGDPLAAPIEVRAEPLPIEHCMRKEIV